MFGRKKSEKEIERQQEAEKTSAIMRGEQEPEQLYDVYICYSTVDMKPAKCFKDCLEERGVSVKFGLADTPSGENIEDAMIRAIAGSKMFIPIITKNSMNSPYFERELSLAKAVSMSRSKTVIRVVYNLDDDSIRGHAKHYFGGYQTKHIKSDNENEIREVANSIADYIDKKKDEGVILDKFMEYSKAGLKNKAAHVLCDIIDGLCDDMSMTDYGIKQMLALFSYTQKLDDLYCDYTDEGKKLAKRKLDTIPQIKAAVKGEKFMISAYTTSIAIRIIYYAMSIHVDIADSMTGGDVTGGLINLGSTKKEYIESQSAFFAKYYECKDKELSSDIDEARKQFITDTVKYVCDGRILTPRTVETVKEIPDTPDNDLLKSVASFMNEGNRIFDMICDEKPAREFLKCLITSYERLKSYSEVVGATGICGECIEKIEELKQKLTKISIASSSDERAENGIKSLLGLSIPKSGEFDVFISHKTEDFDLAVDMYDFLKENLKEAFLDKYTLPEMSEAKYKKSITEALEGSKHFVVLISNLEYLESKWVSLDMELFLTEKDEGRKTGNFLIVVTDDVYDQIMASNKKALSIEYRRFEIIKFKDYKNVILNYLGN